MNTLTTIFSQVLTLLGAHKAPASAPQKRTTAQEVKAHTPAPEVLAPAASQAPKAPSLVTVHAPKANLPIAEAKATTSFADVKAALKVMLKGACKPPSMAIKRAFAENVQDLSEHAFTLQVIDWLQAQGAVITPPADNGCVFFAHIDGHKVIVSTWSNARSLYKLSHKGLGKNECSLVEHHSANTDAVGAIIVTAGRVNTLVSQYCANHNVACIHGGQLANVFAPKAEVA